MYGSDDVAGVPFICDNLRQILFPLLTKNVLVDVNVIIYKG